METTATILHADLDAFYASVEQMLDPSLRGKPIAVGGGVVLAASYEAKAFGICSGMPGRRARELCPELVFVGGHFNDYQRLGDAAIKVLDDFTPLVERISIDEAFADVAGCTHLFGPPAEIASAIRRRVRTEFGLPISVGVARTKHLAKIASQVAKPDGLVVVDPDTELEFLHDLPVELMWGVGPVTKARLLGARGSPSAMGFARLRLPSRASLRSFSTVCGSTGRSSTGRRRRLRLSALREIIGFPRQGGKSRPCRDGGGGEIVRFFASVRTERPRFQH
jgi:DNA polymerase-4